ncbi:MAG: MFS transporter, partial [Deltaproteobacteria bacterium]|nr:MFS transporter [Deltaproteobacteria bacterium]
SLFITSFLWGISSGSLFPSIQALTFTSVAPEYRTEAASSIFNAFDLGIGAGSIAFGLLAEHFETYKAAFWGNGFSLAIFITFYVIYFFLITPSKRLSLTTTNQG